MSRCDLEILLDRPDRTYRPGEEVTGLVCITARQDTRCRGVSITRTWRTHGYGNDFSGPEETLDLEGQDLFAGQKVVHPFSFRVPAGPLTYHGHYLNVDWYIDVKVDVPWAFKPGASEEFIVGAPNSAMAISHGPEHLSGPEPPIPIIGTIVMTLMGIVFLGVSGILGMFFWVVEIAGMGATWVWLLLMLIPLILFGGGVGLLYAAWRNKLAESRLRNIVLEVTPTDVSSGDEVGVRLSFIPHTSLQLRGITFSLEAKEDCISGSSTDQVQKTHEIYREDHEIMGTRSLSPNEPIELSRRLVIPDLDAPSFAAGDNSLRWCVRVQLDIVGWPDWVRYWILTVRPKPLVNPTRAALSKS